PASRCRTSGRPALGPPPRRASCLPWCPRVRSRHEPPAPATQRGQAVRGDETGIEAKRPQSIVRERGKRLQVHDVLHVVLEEEIQCFRMTGPMGPPQADGIETAQPRGLLAPVDPEILLDRLEPAEETEAAERPHHV